MKNIKLEFNKYQNEDNRSLDINLYGNNEELLEVVANKLETEIDNLNFVYETMTELDSGKYNIIGVVEYEHGSMTQIKEDIKHILKQIKSNKI